MVKDATAAIKQAASTKDDHDLFDAADVAFDDGSVGDWVYTVGAAVEVAQQQPNAEVWLVWTPNGAVSWWFGSETDIIQRIQALP